MPEPRRRGGAGWSCPHKRTGFMVHKGATEHSQHYRCQAPRCRTLKGLVNQEVK